MFERWFNQNHERSNEQAEVGLLAGVIRDLSKEEIDKAIDEVAQAYFALSSAPDRSDFRIVATNVFSEPSFSIGNRDRFHLSVSADSTVRAWHYDTGAATPTFVAAGPGDVAFHTSGKNDGEPASTAGVVEKPGSASKAASFPERSQSMRSRAYHLLVGAAGGAMVVTLAGLLIRGAWPSAEVVLRSLLTSIVPLALLLGGLYFYLDARNSKQAVRRVMDKTGR